MTGPVLHGEGCEDQTGIIGVEQAHGIMTIHARCKPPCPRRRAAALFIARLDGDPAEPAT